MQYIDINTIKSEYKQGNCINIVIDNDKFHIGLSEQTTGFGKRKFFICPDCDKRKTKLYFKDKFIVCAECAGYNPYKRIQNGTKGGYLEIEYRMKKFAEMHDIQYEIPFNYMKFVKDKRLNNVKFREYIKILQALENMRFQNIFYKTIYKNSVIRSVLNGSHPLLKRVNLRDMQKYVQNFNS